MRQGWRAKRSFRFSVIGGRAEEVELVCLSLALGEALDEARGDGAEGDIAAAARAADDEEDADRPCLGLGEPWRLRRLWLRADECLRAQRERHIGRGVAEQFPRDPGGFADACHDLDPRVGEAVPQRGPQVAGIVLGVEDGLEEPRADLCDAALHPRRDRGRGLVRVLEKILKIPAQVLLVLVRELELKVHVGGLPGQAVALEFDANPVPVRPDGFLGDAKFQHGFPPRVPAA